MKQERMTSSERMNALLAGKPVDRVLFSPFDMTCGGNGFCARNVGYPVEVIYNNPVKSFQAQVWTQEQYCCDGIPLFGSGIYGCWEFGGKTKFPTSEYEQAPSTVRYPVEAEEDIERLQPPDVKTAGMLPMAMQFSEMQMRTGMPITPFWASPFTCAGNLVGLDKLCRWVIKKPELVHKLLHLCTDHILQVAQYWVDTFGAERIIAHEIIPSEANQVLSARHFEGVALPYLTEVHEKVLTMGIKHLRMHICGEQNLNLPHLAKLPMGTPGIVSFGPEVDIDVAIKHFGDTCIIAGNIPPSIIQEGTPQEVYELAKECVVKGKKAPMGFILSAGCEVPIMAPPYNIYIMIKAVRDFGWYD